MTPPAPIALSSAQLATVQMLARFVPMAMRGSYLRTVAALLKGQRVDDRTVCVASNLALRRVMGGSVSTDEREAS